MSKISNWYRAHKFWSWVIAILVLIIMLAVAFWPREDATSETVAVGRVDVVERVRLSGKIEPADRVDLAFWEAGTVGTIARQVGERVVKGDLIAALESRTLLAERAAAVAEVSIKEAEKAASTVSLEEVTSQYDTIVENARQALLSEGLEAIPSDENSTLTAPTVSGLYTGLEGEYKFNVNRESVSSRDYILANFGFDKAPKAEVAETRGTPLGNHGLLVRFPDGVENYDDTTWYVRIPNQESSVYTANYAAYQKALRDRQVAIENARASLSKSNTASSVAEAEILRARASLDQIDAKIAERQIRAPFDGLVSKVDLDLGESVTAGATVVSMASEADYQITVNVPEAEINKLSLGNLATATLDAYPDGTEFTAEVISLEPAETIIDGVATYKVTLQFKQFDEKIKSGMTAEIVITGSEKRGVLGVPLRATAFRDGETWVRVVKDGKIEERPVTLGLRGSDGLAEVVSGLSEGELVSLRPPAQD